MTTFCLYSLYYLFYWDSNAVILDIKSATVVSNDVTLLFNVTISASAAANFVFSACCILSISCVAEKFKANNFCLSKYKNHLFPYHNKIHYYNLYQK